MHTAPLATRRTALALGILAALTVVRPVYGDTLTLLWDPNPEPVAGYAVYVGTERVDVGNTTTFTVSNAVAGQQYCFTVVAYTSVEGPHSAQVCGYSNRFPTLTNPGSQAGMVGQPASLQLVGHDPDGQAVSYSATGLPPGLFVGSATGYIAGTPTTSGTYTISANVFDGVLTSATQTFKWSVAAAPTADTTAPTVAISSPTSAFVYASPSTMMALGGSASDNVGVTSVSWANDRGGSGTASGTTSWNVASIGLQTGTNVITATARDAAGNQSTATLTVTYTAPDTTAPVVNISSPTSGSTYATGSSLLTVAGSASDNVGVVQVKWANDRGGSGTASGTTNWSASGLVLQSGTNTITVTARDAASNASTAVLTVTYTPPDTTAPTVTILGPTTSASYESTSSVVTIGGTASDDRGVTAVTWANDRGGTGFASGTTSWSVASVNLQSGTNVVTVTAQDAVGNKGTGVLTVVYNAGAPTAPGPSFTLSGSTFSSGKWNKVLLEWSTVSGKQVEVYRNGIIVGTSANKGYYTDSPGSTPGPFTYRVCVRGTSVCSNPITVTP